MSLANLNLESWHFSREGEIWEAKKHLTLSLTGDTILLYNWSINFPASDKLIDCLSKDELGRANRYKFLHHRHKFQNARGVLRHLLGKHLELHPKEVIFEYTPFGKPQITKQQNKHHLHFNMSHTDEMATCIIAKEREVGIDTESFNAGADKELMGEFLTEKELGIVGRMSESNQKMIQLWTMKEAWIKLNGLGLDHLDQVPDLSVCDFKLSEHPGFHSLEGSTLFSFVAKKLHIISGFIR